MARVNRRKFQATCESLETRQLLSTYYILNAFSGKVLDDPGFSASDGTAVQQYQLFGGTNQRWTFVPLANGSDLIVNAYSGKVLEDPGFSRANGTVIQQNRLTGATNQQWKLGQLSNGYVEVVNAFSGKTLDRELASERRHGSSPASRGWKTASSSPPSSSTRRSIRWPWT